MQFHWGTVDSMLSSLGVTSSLGIGGGKVRGSRTQNPISGFSFVCFGLILLGLHWPDVSWKLVLGSWGPYPQMTLKRHKSHCLLWSWWRKQPSSPCYSLITQYDNLLPYQAF